MSEFSRRTAWDSRPSCLADLVADARAGGRALHDLSESNPTRSGLVDAEAALALLSDVRGAQYAPEPFGARPAREAVAAYYGRRGVAVDADQLLLTASSSEAYSWLFKLLCDPGDVALIPQPAYPLLPLLADLESVALRQYPLDRQAGWRIDLPALDRLARDNKRARAILLVHPGNPTGAYLHGDDRGPLCEIAKEHDLSLVVDEVFLDYRHGPPDARHQSLAGFDGVSCYVLSGLSKVALLPQLKLAWMVVSGPRREEALARLEIIADSYLSVSGAVQLAVPEILAGVGEVQARLGARLRTNLNTIDTTLREQGSDCPLRRLRVQGGWYALIEVPRTRSDDAWVEHLIREESVIVHPGDFYGIAEPGTMVVSLLDEPSRFEEAIVRAARCWARA